jgi:hypothetical protein
VELGLQLELRLLLRVAHEERVVFTGDAAEELEGDDEEDHADAGAGEHAARADVPLAGEKAWSWRALLGLILTGLGMFQEGLDLLCAG